VSNYQILLKYPATIMISDRIEIAYSNTLKEGFIYRNDLENIFIGKEDIGYTH